LEAVLMNLALSVIVVGLVTTALAIYALAVHLLNPESLAPGFGEWPETFTD
jgi:hypothetical protein